MVYACILALKHRLSDTEGIYKYTTKIRKDLLESLDKRFSKLIEQDLFLVSTFLDPHFGNEQFDEDKIKIVKSRIVSLV